MDGFQEVKVYQLARSSYRMMSGGGQWTILRRAQDSLFEPILLRR